MILKTTRTEPPVLPCVIRVNRIPFIAMSVIFLPLITAILFTLGSGNPAKDGVGWWAGLLIATGFGLYYSAFVTQEIRLSGQNISYRRWFFTKGMDYSGISGVRCYYRHPARGLDSPMLELSGINGDTIPINLLPFLNREKISDIHDILETYVPQADLANCWRELFSEPGDSD